MRLADFVASLVVLALKSGPSPEPLAPPYPVVGSSDFKIRGVHVGDYYHSFDYTNVMPVKLETLK